ncbi:hypothetical protein FGG78_12675 [Thioclava sp. BHET1]|nr:hypothetical protein FGG78_12675 [Thioclava sp. BHET1]
MRYATALAFSALIPVLTACQQAAPAPDAGAQMQLPQEMRGRWGLTANDCTARHEALGDNKGLITIGPRTITFYESRATLRSISERAADRVDATFDVSGEGMEWTREMVLEVQDGGRMLIRRDLGADAQPGALRYMACSAS